MAGVLGPVGVFVFLFCLLVLSVILHKWSVEVVSFQCITGL